MKSMHPVFVLAGLGLVGMLAMGSGVGIAQPAAPAPAKIGSSLIGKLEGPEIILDAKAFPKTFKEAPMLAAQVKAGKLPSVDKRLPEPRSSSSSSPCTRSENTAATGVAPSPGRPTTRTATGSTRPTRSSRSITPAPRSSPASPRDWKVSDDGKTTTIFLRKGAKWSDGSRSRPTISCSGTTTST